jgi:dTDP-4-dehydrorhamnose reductase
MARWLEEIFEIFISNQAIIMKIIITGKNGQLGRALLGAFEGTSYDVLSFGREDLDVTSIESVRAVIEEHKPDIILNTSAQHATLDSEIHPENPFSVNAFAVMNLALICKEKSIRLITYSSDYVFDGLKGKPYAEGDRQTPVQLFGISKYMGEIMALNYDPDAVVIRTCGVYGGLTGSRSKKNFVLNILDESKSKKVIHVSLDQIVNPTYANDLAIATIALIEKNLKGGIYNLVNEGYCSWAEFSQEIMKIRNLNTKIDPIDRKGMSGGLRRPLFSSLENIKAKKQGIVLPHWKDGLRRYLDYLSLNNL